MQILRSFCHKFPEKNDEFLEKGGRGVIPDTTDFVAEFLDFRKKAFSVKKFPQTFRKNLVHGGRGGWVPL